MRYENTSTRPARHQQSPARRRAVSPAALGRVALALATAFCGLMFAGCGSGSGNVKIGSGGSLGASRTAGKVTLTVQWPKLTDAGATRLIPKKTQSLVVSFTSNNTAMSTILLGNASGNPTPTEIKDANGNTIALFIPRPANLTQSTVSVAIPTGSVTATVGAFTAATVAEYQANPVPIATAMKNLMVVATPDATNTNQLDLALASNITQIRIDEVKGASDTTVLTSGVSAVTAFVKADGSDKHYFTVTALDSQNHTILTAPDEVSWSLPTTAAATATTKAAIDTGANGVYTLTPLLSTYVLGISTPVTVTASINTTDASVASGTPKTSSFALTVVPTVAITAGPAPDTASDGTASGIFQGGTLKFTATAYGANLPNAITYTVYGNVGGTGTPLDSGAASSGTAKSITIPVTLATAVAHDSLVVSLDETGNTTTPPVATDSPKPFDVTGLSVTVMPPASFTGPLLQGGTVTFTSALVGAKASAVTAAFNVTLTKPTNANVTFTSDSAGAASLTANYDVATAGSYTVTSQATVTAGSANATVTGTYGLTVAQVTINPITATGPNPLVRGATTMTLVPTTTVNGAVNTGIVWSLSPAAAAPVSFDAATGTVTVAAGMSSGGADQTYTLTATSSARSDVSATYTVTVKP